MIINVFRNKLFPLYSGNYYEEFKEESSEDENEELKKTFEQLNELDRVYAALIRRYFMENSSTKIIKKLKNYGMDPNKLQMYNNLLNRLNIGLQRLKDDIKNMSKDKVEEKKHLNHLKDLVGNIIDTKQKLNDMPPLETEEEAEKRQQLRQGLKILTPKQMITRLPILLSQVKAGNNSKKLKNEIRQIIYSLYRSKNVSKTIYNYLISFI